MAGPIYKLWMASYAETWYQLSPSDQEQLLDKVRAARAQVGGKEVLTCLSGWSNEEWMGFGVEEYPSLAAVQQLNQIHLSLDWQRYTRSFSTLGIRWPADDPTQTGAPQGEHSIFKLWRTGPTASWYELSAEERAAFTPRAASTMESVGASLTVRCVCLWNTEQWTLFGVEEYPSEDAAQQVADLNFAAEHFRYVAGWSILGAR